MFHSPYCFLSKLTIQNPICKKVPICFTLLVVFFQKNYSEPHSQNRLYEASFCCNICQNFLQISIILPHINKTGVENSSVHPNLLPPHRFFTYFQFSNFFKFLTYLFRTLTRSDGHIGHLLTVQVTAGLQSRPDHGIPFFC